MNTVDLSQLSGGLFILSSLFFLEIGGLVSYAVLQFVKHRKHKAIISLVLAIISMIAFIYILNTWYL
ncbi:hypothetical protein [Ammoniphilus resinae]|uniref:Uncharacterized protein n=1 Tax=Ammoniphilus resinae TaxID=861532 RepID=A0ABS4GLW4_9BACL|nr:hypothetical protein [Ammoniphilus resinae]MBP1931258.1 hypothetical protein [Ammoniphilus resinae]